MTTISETAQLTALGSLLESGSDVYVGLFSTLPTATAAGTEASGSGYARVAWDAWVNTTISDTPTRQNKGAVELAALTGALTSIDGWGIWDAVSSGNLLLYGPFKDTEANDVSEKSYVSGATPRFISGDLRAAFSTTDEVTNGDFEAYTNPASSPDDWAVYNGGTISSSRITGMSGSGYATRINVTVGSYAQIFTTVNGPAWNAFKTYLVSWWARAESGDCVGKTSLLGWSGAPAHNPAVSTAIYNPALSSSWQFYAWLITTDTDLEDANRMAIKPANGMSSAGEVDMDDVSVFAVDGTGIYDAVTGEYSKILEQLLPPGKAWDIDPAGDFKNLLTALGHSLERVVDRAQDLLREYDPTTMLELLEDWERVLGLPGDNPSPPTTIADRRSAVAARLLGNGDPTVAYFEAVASGQGYTDAYVNQHFLGPFVPGSVAGAPLASDWPFVWEMVTPRGDDDGLLEWSLNELAPLHTVLVMFWLLAPTAQSFDSAGSDDFNGVAYNGSNLWVAVGSNGEIQTSPDGETWTQRTAAGGYTGEFYGVAYNGSNLWCAVGDGGEIQTSPDGITWTARTAAGGFSSYFFAVAHDQSGLWVAVGTDEIQTSPDGITWTSRSYAGSVTTWIDVAYGGGTWVAVGSEAGLVGRIESSTDGTTWVAETPVGTASQFQCIAHDGSTGFVAAGRNGEVQTSANGSDWREREIDSIGSAIWKGAAYVGDRWILVCSSGGYVAESWYGDLWYVHQLGGSQQLNAIASDGTTAVVVGESPHQVYTAEV